MKAECVLCNSIETKFLCKRDNYDYLHCSVCDLIFVKPDQRLDPNIEKSRYDHHQNDPYDLNYRKFLNQLIEPLEKRLTPGSFGLDFGSGPGPTLNIMFEEMGYKMNIYDPFYANDRSVFDLKYDFITATETVEHLFDPKKEFDLLWSCLKPGRYLGIMTKMVPSEEEFPDWYYRRDDTHVVFYRPATFQWMADQWDATVEIIGDQVAIFQKKN
jgi:hypothetical protein